jgi:hypothetical protein
MKEKNISTWPGFNPRFPRVWVQYATKSQHPLWDIDIVTILTKDIKIV